MEQLYFKAEIGGQKFEAGRETWSASSYGQEAVPQDEAFPCTILGCAYCC